MSLDFSVPLPLLVVEVLKEVAAGFRLLAVAVRGEVVVVEFVPPALLVEGEEEKSLHPQLLRVVCYL